MKENDFVIQQQGPCVGQMFRIVEVDGSLLKVRLVNPKPPFTSQSTWSHKDNFYLPRK